MAKSQKYEVMIEGEISSSTLTFEELIDAGLLDDYDSQIKVRLVGETKWIIARDYPFNISEAQSDEVKNRNFTIDEFGQIKRNNSSSSKEKKNYRVDEFGQIIRTSAGSSTTPTSNNSGDAVEPVNTGSTTSSEDSSKKDNDGCSWYTYFIAAIIIIRLLLKLIHHLNS